MNVFLICMLCALVWGIAPIFEKISLQHTSSFVALTIRSIATSIVLITISFAMGKHTEIISVDSKSLLFILVGGFFGILGLFLYFVALKQADASRVVPLVNVFPLFTAFYSVALLGEKLTVSKWVGIAFIIAGIILLNQQSFRSHVE